MRAVRTAACAHAQAEDGAGTTAAGYAVGMRFKDTARELHAWAAGDTALGSAAVLRKSSRRKPFSRIQLKPFALCGMFGPMRIDHRGSEGDYKPCVCSTLATQFYPKGWFKALRGVGWMHNRTS